MAILEELEYPKVKGTDGPPQRRNLTRVVLIINKIDTSSNKSAFKPKFFPIEMTGISLKFGVSLEMAREAILLAFRTTNWCKFSEKVIVGSNFNS
jgi:hypothetical protein